jgi:hypothetical protein
MKIASNISLATLLLFTAIAAPLRAQDGDAKVNEPVRIDNTGIHVGGSDPVDINVPDWGRRIGPLIPVIAILSVFGSPVVIIGLFFYFRHRRNSMLHETLRAMVEKGVPIPPELLAGGGAALANNFNAARRGITDLRNGLILIGVGAGIMALGSEAGFAKLGLIPLFIGVAMIVAWLIGNKMKAKQIPQ